MDILFSRILAALALLTVFTSEAYAKWYEIEVVIFTQSSDLGKTEETWALPGYGFELEPDLPSIFALSQTNSNNMMSGSLYSVPANQRRLSNIAYTLQKSPRQVLAHFAWRSQGYPKSRAPWIKFYGGENYGGQFSSASDVIPITALDASQTNPPTLLSHNSGLTENEVWALLGKVRFYAKNYYHLEFDMAYRVPDTITSEKALINKPANIAETEWNELDDQQRQMLSLHDSSTEVQINQKVTSRYLQHYTFSDKRRLKLYEKHYIDHPILGIVAQVRRVSFTQTGAGTEDAEEGSDESASPNDPDENDATDESAAD